VIRVERNKVERRSLYACSVHRDSWVRWDQQSGLTKTKDRKKKTHLYIVKVEVKDAEERWGKR
jgi:hypothetical protein